MTADLHVTFFQHVEQTDLNALREIGQFVHGKDAPVGARHQAVMNCEFVGEIAAFRHPDGVDLADQISDRSVWGGQLLAQAIIAVHP